MRYGLFYGPLTVYTSTDHCEQHGIAESEYHLYRAVRLSCKKVKHVRRSTHTLPVTTDRKSYGLEVDKRGRTMSYVFP